MIQVDEFIPLNIFLSFLIVVALTFVVIFAILVLRYFNMSNIRFDDIKLKFSLIISILLVALLLFMPFTANVTYVSSSGGEIIEHVEVSEIKSTDYSGFDERFYVDVSVDYSNLSRVTITTKNGVMVDSHTFKQGVTQKRFLLDVVSSKIDYYRIVSLDENGDIINEGRIELNYTEKKEKMGALYRLLN